MLLSLVAISIIIVSLAFLSDDGSGAPTEDGVYAEFLDTNGTYDPNGKSEVVLYRMDIWTSFNESETDWFDIVLEIDAPESIRYEFSPTIARHVDDNPSRVLLMVSPSKSILAGSYNLRIYAYAISNNGSYLGQPLGDVTLDVLGLRDVSVEFAGGNMIPYYHDIPQITNNLLLINEGNTVEQVFCRYTTNDEDINVSAHKKGSSERISLTNPVEIVPGGYVIIDVVFFIDDIPDEDGAIPITIEVVSSEDGQVLDSRNSSISKLPEKEDEEPLNPYYIGLGVAAIVIVAWIIFYRQRGRTKSE